MLHAPEFQRDPLPSEMSSTVARAFHEGHAEDYAARSLVRAGIVYHHPLHGGIFWRREPVKYIIVHSTETGIPLSAQRVIDSWGSAGRRHAGAQYVVDRDGTIFQAVDPDLATVHVNIFKTLPGINNDNSIGIEMCHTGRQNYPQEQREAVIKLVAYLQDRYKIADTNVITHRYAQQGDHTDPVNFDWEGFLADKDRFRTRAIAYKMNRVKEDASSWDVPETVAPDAVVKTAPEIRVINTGVPMQPTRLTPVIVRPTLTPRPTTVAPAPAFVPAAQSGKMPLDLRGPIEVDPNFVEKLSPSSVPQGQIDFAPTPVNRKSTTPETSPAPGATSAPVPSEETQGSGGGKAPSSDVKFFVHQ